MMLLLLGYCFPPCNKPHNERAEPHLHPLEEGAKQLALPTAL